MSGAYYPPSDSDVPVTRSSTKPISPNQGDTWDQIDNNGNVTGCWYWNGTAWISRGDVQQIALPLGNGQVIAIGGIVGLITTDTTDTIFSIGNLYSIYLIKLTISFTTAGTITNSNYWRLLFKSNGSTVQTLNITSGNNSEVTGSISKTSTDINLLYNSSNRYTLNLNKIGLAPNINNPIVTIEYRLSI